MPNLAFEQLVENEESLIAELEQDYTSLDSVVVRSILSDFDFTQPAQLEQARAILDSLQSEAVVEDASDFDPSGTSGCDAGPRTDAATNRVGKTSVNDEALSISNETDATGVSNRLSSLNLRSSSDSDIADDAMVDEFGHLDDDGKIARLCEMFPNEKLGDITYTLGKSKGNVTRSMDILLNHAWLNETREGEEAISRRGIDAFDAEQGTRRNNKKNRRNRKFKSLDEYASSDLRSSSQAVNKWEIANADINFITMRTELSSPVVSSTYHKNEASRPKTILAIAKQNVAEQKSTSNSDVLDMDAVGLSRSFPTISYDIAAALIRLTSPSISYAHDFAKAVSSPSSSSSQIHRIIPQYAPIRISEDTDETPSPPASPYAGSSASLLATRGAAFNQASHYYRKGKSDRLMGGAAAYYASVGREAHQALQATTAAEADALVSRQSTSTQLDLHGVNVKDATRIANHRVQQWWDNLGESKIKGGGRPGAGAGYQIITGVGHHSQGGVGKLGPAVFKSLASQGWKVEAASHSGCLVVKGVASGRR
ncbi:hypothetical protein E2P81_ATG10085 [Venturia nashicola]|uniref:Smr domain-containing protein n=1 Tax=Venturia nashicola TaxID=86259 RepID=A0A4Z1NZR5_9PEZI|nr:hypothetical protein E6O75_ATG10305 [Venturia nashicola]TLD18263.1 hypothetical protein E2P81_ATG10085 [Venturia nashicola]